MTSTFRLTPDFALGEFSVSAEHPELVEPVPDYLGPAVVRLAFAVLQPIRDRVGRPLRILSCYRSPALNDAVGGSATSQHTRAEAADFTTEGIATVFRDLLAGNMDLPVGQVITYPAQHFVHIALPSRRYPLPSYHLHWPAKGHVYRPLESVAHLDRLMGG